MHRTAALLILFLAGCGSPDDGSPFGGGGSSDGGASDGGASDSGSGDGGADCDPVVLAFSGQAETVSGTPLGGASLQDAAFSGRLGYLPCLSDLDDTDGFGEYQHAGDSIFELSLGDLAVTGSGDATVEIVQTGSTFRFVDGADQDGRAMAVDGAADPDLELRISTSAADDAAFSDDGIPQDDWVDEDAAHTFSLADDQGTVLLQWTSLAVE